MFECVYIQMQTSIITVSLDKSTLTKSLHGYSGAFLDFHIVCHSGGGVACDKMARKGGGLHEMEVNRVSARHAILLWNENPLSRNLISRSLFELDVICRKLPSAESKVGEKSQKFNSGTINQMKRQFTISRSVKEKGGDFHLQSLQTCHPTKSPVGKALDAVVVERPARKW